MEAALVILLLAAAARGKGTSAPTETTPASAPPSPSGDAGTPVKAALGVLGSVVGTISTALGGTTTAAGGAAGAAAPPVALATAGQVALVGLEAGALGATGIIVGVIVAFIIAERINAAQAIDKDWQSYALGLNINALALNQFEASAVAKVLSDSGRTFTVRESRDFRLDRYANGQKIVFQGWRKSFQFIPKPGDELVFSKIRAMAFEYLRWRSVFGYRMIRAWNIVTPNPDFGWSETLLQSDYERSAGEPCGNLKNVPHAALGNTVVARSDDANPYPPVLELLGSAAPKWNYVDGISLTDEEQKFAKLVALVDATSILRWDPRGLESDPAHYARVVADALQWGGNTVYGLTLQTGPKGEGLIRLDPEAFGQEFFINPAGIRAGRPDSWRAEAAK